MSSARAIAAHRPNHAAGGHLARSAAAEGSGANFPETLDAAFSHIAELHSDRQPEQGRDADKGGSGENLTSARGAPTGNGSAAAVDLPADRNVQTTQKPASTASGDAAPAGANGRTKRAIEITGGQSAQPSAASPSGNQIASPGAALMANIAAAAVAVLVAPAAVGKSAATAPGTPPVSASFYGDAQTTASDAAMTGADGGAAPSDDGALSMGMPGDDVGQSDGPQIDGSSAILAPLHLADMQPGASANTEIPPPNAGTVSIDGAGSLYNAGSAFDTSARDQGATQGGLSAAPAVAADGAVPAAGYSFDVSTGGTSPFGTDPTNQNVADAGPSDTLDQVSAMMVASLRHGDQDVLLRLNPPELGDVNVRIAVSGQQVSAWFDAAQTQVQQALGQGMAQLHTNLAAAGYNLTGAWVGGEAWTPRGWSEQAPKGFASQHWQRESETELPSGASRSTPAGAGVSIYV